jgi:hypothetical protein
MEKNPWWQNVQGPFLVWEGPKGVKPDGGGNIRGQGRVGDMKLHRAAHNRRKDGTQGLVCCWAHAGSDPLGHDPVGQNC